MIAKVRSLASATIRAAGDEVRREHLERRKAYSSIVVADVDRESLSDTPAGSKRILRRRDCSTPLETRDASK